MAVSIHDNLIVAYSVLCEEGKILLHTRIDHGRTVEWTDVIFSGVIAHYFEDVLFGQGNILFGIDEYEPAKIYADNRLLFERRKPWFWPPIEYSDERDLLAQLGARKIRGFDISSSLGLSGWILAESLAIVSKSPYPIETSV